MQKTFLFLLLASLSFGANAGDKSVTLDSTKICYPVEYSPDTSYMSAILAPISDKLDDSTGQELIYIPASEIKKKVPEYTLSHVNKWGVNLKHDIMGLAYSMSGVGKPYGMAESAWSIYEDTEKSPLVEKDEKTGLFKLWEYRDIKLFWHYIESPPPKTPNFELPKNWYVGMCDGDQPLNYKCSQSVFYKDIMYSYDLQAHDMAVREKVKLALKSLFKEWEMKCK